MAAAALSLNRGEATKPVLSKQDQSVRILQSILKALEDPQPQDKDFREQQSGGQGQQSGGQPAPLIPPVAEVRLLKLMQEEAMERTRDAEAATTDWHADPEQVEAVGKLQKDLAEQADALIKKQMKNNGKKPETPAPEPGKDGGESRPAGGPAPGGGAGQ